MFHVKQFQVHDGMVAVMSANGYVGVDFRNLLVTKDAT
jgi:hypothetical protein